MAASAEAGAPGAEAVSAGGCWFWNESKFWNDILDMEVFESRLLDRCVASLEIGPEDQTKLLYPGRTAVVTFDFVGVVKERRSY